jgi:hypothetical protein
MRYYNKGLNKKSEAKVVLTRSEKVLLVKSEEVCAKCPPTLPVGVEKKHNSYDRYLNRIRKQTVT